jgi:hypothetical protein
MTDSDRAIREWNRLVGEQIAKRPTASAGDVLRFEGALMLGHALVLGLTCIAEAIRSRE